MSPRPVLDGGGGCSFKLRLPDPHRPQEQHLIMGPGGYRFGDYWRMGLPLEIIVIAVSIPMIMWVWPF